MKICFTCKQEKPLSEFIKSNQKKDGVTSYCKSCDRKRTKKWRDNNPDRSKAQQARYRKANPGWHYWSKFGITHEDKMALFAKQGRKCAGCGSLKHNNSRWPESGDSGWVIDHDHKTKKIRGLLCYGCNVALGHAKDSVQVLRGLTSYLENNASTGTKIRFAGMDTGKVTIDDSQASYGPTY